MEKISLEYIKCLGKNKSKESFDELLRLFYSITEIDLKREIVSSIGRQNDIDRIAEFINKEGFSDQPMELIYQMYRTCLYKGKFDQRMFELNEDYAKTIEGNDNYYEIRR
ncbi:MAG: hypothetical protein IJ728_02380 [Selenomonadaceae bacterium]|nr:hypothetical protein [Selenomonadaceae bacterium]